MLDQHEDSERVLSPVLICDSCVPPPPLPTPRGRVLELRTVLSTLLSDRVPVLTVLAGVSLLSLEIPWHVLSMVERWFVASGRCAQISCQHLMCTLLDQLAFPSLC